jgi:hypothetical protein
MVGLHEKHVSDEQSSFFLPFFQFMDFLDEQKSKPTKKYKNSAPNLVLAVEEPEEQENTHITGYFQFWQSLA